MASVLPANGYLGWIFFSFLAAENETLSSKHATHIMCGVPVCVRCSLDIIDNNNNNEEKSVYKYIRNVTLLGHSCIAICVIYVENTKQMRLENIYVLLKSHFVFVAHRELIY